MSQSERYQPDPNRLWVVKDRLEKRNRGPRHLATRFATRTLCGQESAALELCGDKAATCKECLRVVLATEEDVGEGIAEERKAGAIRPLVGNTAMPGPQPPSYYREWREARPMPYGYSVKPDGGGAMKAGTLIRARSRTFPRSDHLMRFDVHSSPLCGAKDVPYACTVAEWRGERMGVCAECLKAVGRLEVER